MWNAARLSLALLYFLLDLATVEGWMCKAESFFGSTKEIYCPGLTDPKTHVACCGTKKTRFCCAPDNDLNIPLIIGLMVGGLVVVILTILLCCCLCSCCLLAKRRREKGVVFRNGPDNTTTTSTTVTYTSHPQMTPGQPYPVQTYPPQAYPTQAYPTQPYQNPQPVPPGYPMNPGYQPLPPNAPPAPGFKVDQPPPYPGQ